MSVEFTFSAFANKDAPSSSIKFMNKQLQGEKHEKNRLPSFNWRRDELTFSASAKEDKPREPIGVLKVEKKTSKRIERKKSFQIQKSE